MHDIHSEKYLTPVEMAREIRRTPTTLCRWRAAKAGPPHIVLNGRVLYPAALVTEWLKAQMVTSA